MPTWPLSAQTHPGLGAPVAVKRSPALFLACIARGGIWSGRGFVWPILGLYWWWEILKTAREKYSFFPNMEQSTPLDCYYHLLTADFTWSCLAPQPSEFQSAFLVHLEICVCQKTGCLVEKSSNLWWYVHHSEIYSTRHPYFFGTMLRGEFPSASLPCLFSHLLCSFQKNLKYVLQEQLRENMEGRTISTLVILSDPFLQSGRALMNTSGQLGLSRFKVSPNPIPGPFFFFFFL